MTRKPVVALVGRPNVGKSTLFNRLVGRRIAIVEDLPGTTRDRIYGQSDWNGVDFIVVDTGGLESDSSLIRQVRQGEEGPEALAENSSRFVVEIRNQAQVAMAEADAIIFVVDGMEGVTAADQELAETLRRTQKPLFLAVNKAESKERQLNAAEFWNLGLTDPVPISAYHGDGVGDLLDEVVKVLPPYRDAEDDEKPDVVRIAILGRPNVGKSSLLNALVGVERSIVSNVPGTTRDPIDTELVFHGQKVTLIDTAGIRRRGKVEPGIEKYSVLRSVRSIDRTDVVLLLIDAQEGVTAQDTHVASYVLEKAKSVIVLVNKWDAIDKDAYTMNTFTENVREALKFMDYVPVIFISALTKQRVNKILPLALEVAEERKRRIRTGELNQFLQEMYAETMPPSRQGRRLRLYYATQVEIEPPTFVIFVNDPELVHFSYQRHIENKLRDRYPYVGTPIRIFMRKRTSNRDEA
jgi:GTP-binding protein